MQQNRRVQKAKTIKKSEWQFIRSSFFIVRRAVRKLASWSMRHNSLEFSDWIHNRIASQTHIKFVCANFFEPFPNYGRLCNLADAVWWNRHFIRLINCSVILAIAQTLWYSAAAYCFKQIWTKSVKVIWHPNQGGNDSLSFSETGFWWNRSNIPKDCHNLWTILLSN